MDIRLHHKSISIIQDIDKAILVMRSAGKWLLESGKNPSKWWQLQNLNREFLLQHAEPDEFYVVLIDNKPAAAAILQNSERNQSWKSIDKQHPQLALYIHWLCVNRKYAGKNLPQILVDFACTQAKNKGLKLLRLDASADEEKLINVYKKLGFHLMGTEQEDNWTTAFFQKSVV